MDGRPPHHARRIALEQRSPPRVQLKVFADVPGGTMRVANRECQELHQDRSNVPDVAEHELPIICPVGLRLRLVDRVLLFVLTSSERER